MAPIGWFFVLALWVLFFWLYRDYRLDYFRQQLFGLRDELFDLALVGELDFNCRAYDRLRSLINASIQYGHCLGFLDFLYSAVITTRDPHQREYVRRFHLKWENACGVLEPDVREKVEAIRRRMHFVILEQIVFTSPVLVFSFVALILFVLLLLIKGAVIDSFTKLLSRRSFGRAFDTQDFVAMIAAQ